MRRFAFVWLWAALMAGLCGTPAFAQGSAVPEYALKSALLFKLPQFVYHPDMDRSAPITMCLLGSNPFGNTLEKLAETPLDGRKFRYVRFDSVAEVSGCHFLFISRSETRSLETIFQKIGNRPIVTVSDIEGFTRSGGMIELALGGEGTPITILINRQAAQKRQIEFNAQLLRLARVVEP